MHKTDTLDYIIILSGELYLIMEDCETLLKPGNIVINVRLIMHGLIGQIAPVSSWPF